MAVWDARSLQLVWFPTKTENIKANTVLEALSGEAVQSYQENRTPNPRAPFLSAAVSEVDELRFAAQVNVSRIDFFITPVQSDDITQGGQSQIDTTASLNRVLARIATLDSNLIGDVTRLSIVASLIQPEKDYRTAASHIFSFLGLDVPQDEYSDVQFQINKRKVISQDIIINRLLRLSVEMQQLIEIQVDPSTGTQVSSRAVAADEIFSAILIDVNTVPDGGIISHARQLDTFQIIVAEILRLAEHRALAALD